MAKRKAQQRQSVLCMLSGGQLYSARAAVSFVFYEQDDRIEPWNFGRRTAHSRSLPVVTGFQIYRRDRELFEV